MPWNKKTIGELRLTEEEREFLKEELFKATAKLNLPQDGIYLSKSAITKATKTYRRCKILLLYSEGRSINAIANDLKVTRPMVYRCVRKALNKDIGPINALEDHTVGRGRPKIFTQEVENQILQYLTDGIPRREIDNRYGTRVVGKVKRKYKDLLDKKR